jgi:hypothetical protein
MRCQVVGRPEAAGGCRPGPPTIERKAIKVEHSPHPAEMVVVPWQDPVAEALGHWPGDPYIE